MIEEAFPMTGENMNITITQFLFVLVSISTAIYILNAISYRVFLQKYERTDFFESLKGLITVDFNHPSFPVDDEDEIRKRQKTHDRLFYVCVSVFVICVFYTLAMSNLDVRGI